jgi:hypothetical protein
MVRLGVGSGGHDVLVATVGVLETETRDTKTTSKSR